MKKIIVIVGPTASSKSSLAIKLATDFNAEIINADSFQVYKELNVGINKPSKQQLLTIKHHLINSHSIYDEFDVKIFQDLCIQLIDKILVNNKNVILCGGSNLYIDAVIKGYNLDKSMSRNKINYFDDWNYDDIYNYVLERDYQEAMKINKNNKKRIIRAAQIIYATNQKKSTLDNNQLSYVYDCFIIQTNIDKQLLYDKINKRVDLMLDNGWYDEVKSLLNQDLNVVNRQAFNAIGYKQIANAIVNNQAIDVEHIKKLSRNLAKKQLTWCKNKYNNVYHFNVDNDDYMSLNKTIRQWLTKKTKE